MAERAAQEHRRKQKIETLKCYAQDLTPLIHGNKPKKLPLPVPSTQQGASTLAAKKKLKKTPPNAARKPGKIVQLAPISKPTNNQLEQAAFSPALRVAIPRQSYETYAIGSATTKAAPTPLTAEIKPASWMYELLTSDPVLSSTKSDESFLPPSHSRTQLTTLHEDEDDDGSDAVDHHAKLAYGQRVTLAPLVPSVSSPSVSSGVTASSAGSYSSERLASLLQKYNVTVASTRVTS